MVQTLEAILRSLTRPAAEALAKREEGNRVRCLACAHRCLIAEGQSGVCKVRFNEGGTLHVPWGYTAGAACDPIEKKPFFHVFPGSLALSFGMLGCDLHCSYCQNWLTSQTLRDEAAGFRPSHATPEELVKAALAHNASTISSTYNEPLITADWAVDVFKLAKEQGLPGSFVSNGNATPEVLEFIRPYVDFYKVDLKSFSEKSYRQLGCTLKAVLETIERLIDMKFWVEVVTLVVPGFNDSDEELKNIARFLAGVSVDIPWHVTAFHQDYHMTEPENTPVSTLLRAVKIGREAGLRFVYAGNRSGQVGTHENTYCPECKTLLVERYGYHIRKNLLSQSGHCPSCGLRIPGVWTKKQG
jgi:pyruvate formate lyase activating enzyme